MKKIYCLLMISVLAGCSTTGQVEDDTTSSSGGSSGQAPVVDAGSDVAELPDSGRLPNAECRSNEECASQVCKAEKCQAPTATDGVRNGEESDKDCGGGAAPKCGLDKTCGKHSDCESDACDYRGRCIEEKGCVAHFGGDTCGEGEIATPGAKHESCCTKLALPSGVKADKYVITAGRVRQMVERTNGDVRGWYLNNRASLRPDAVAQLDQFVDYLPGAMTGGEYDIDRQLGSYIYIHEQPSRIQGCATKGTGTHTYWLPKEVNEFYGDIDHGFSQDVLDTKPAQCITLPLSIATCVWEGARLQTWEESEEVWGGERFPWGASPEPGGYRMLNGAWTLVGPGDLKFGTTAPACPTCDGNIANWTNNYQYPVGGNPLVPSDYSYFISPPGRFARDKGPWGHMDAGGLLIQWTATKAQYIDRQGRSPTFRMSKNSSWEGHEFGYDKYAFFYNVKYGKFSAGRCVK